MIKIKIIIMKSYVVFFPMLASYVLVHFISVKMPSCIHKLFLEDHAGFWPRKPVTANVSNLQLEISPKRQFLSTV